MFPENLRLLAQKDKVFRITRQNFNVMFKTTAHVLSSDFRMFLLLVRTTWPKLWNSILSHGYQQQEFNHNHFWYTNILAYGQLNHVGQFWTTVQNYPLQIYRWNNLYCWIFFLNEYKSISYANTRKMKSQKDLLHKLKKSGTILNTPLIDSYFNVKFFPSRNALCYGHPCLAFAIIAAVWNFMNCLECEFFDLLVLFKIAPVQNYPNIFFLYLRLWYDHRAASVNWT